MPTPLLERPTVRAAAIRLAKALMREYGIKPKDLQPKELQAPEPRPSRRVKVQLVMPVEAVPKCKRTAPIEAVKAPPTPLPAEAGMAIPDHVQIQRCPGHSYDPRYQVDPAAFAGGEFLADWRRRRAAREGRRG